jgi:hypothetical protein
MLFNEHVVGRLGNVLVRDIVPRVKVVELDSAILSQQDAGILDHDVIPGCCHASDYHSSLTQFAGDIADLAARQGNRDGIARLAVLLGWCAVEGLTYFIDDTQTVYSVDHGDALGAVRRQ